MHESEIGRGKLRSEPPLRAEPRRLLMGESSGLGMAQVVGNRALGNPQRTGDLRVRQSALVLESEKLRVSVAWQSVGRAPWSPFAQKRSETTSPVGRITTHRPSIPTILNGVSTMLNAIPNILNGIPTPPPNRSASFGNRVQHRRNRVHVPSEMP